MTPGLGVRGFRKDVVAHEVRSRESEVPENKLAKEDYGVEEG